MLIDANLLVYAHEETSPHYELARRWFEAQLNGDYAVGIPWESIVAYVRITTNPRIVEAPISGNDAWARVERWFASPVVWTPGPTDRHREVLGSLVTSLNLTAKLVPDAHLAALALEHGLELFSADSDFARFPGVRWRNPLAV